MTIRAAIAALFPVLLLMPATAQQTPSDADRAKLERWPYSLSLPELAREEIVFPAIEGFQVLKGDFHVHTFYSDGLVSAEVRVVEAWRDGLDVLSLTDHVEYQDIAIPYDRERSYGRALPVAKQLGIVMVRGVELSQHYAKTPVANPSDFVVHFVREETKLATHFEAELEEAISQGTLIVWAHPGPKWQPIAETLVRRGKLDGIELRNGGMQGRGGTSPHAQAWLWPEVMDWSLKHDLAVFASSDAHWPIDFQYDRSRGERRDMTLLLASSRDGEGVRDAIKARRTLAYFGGVMWGRERWLRALADGSLEIKYPPPSGPTGRQRHSLLVSNRSSFEFRAQFTAPGASFQTREIRIPPGPATVVPLNLGSGSRDLQRLDLTVKVTNMLSGIDRPLELRRTVAAER